MKGMMEQRGDERGDGAEEYWKGIMEQRGNESGDGAEEQ